MPRGLFFASIERILKDVAQYAFFPVAKTGFDLYFRKHAPTPEIRNHLSNTWASALCGIFYVGFTAHYATREATVLDFNARDAVSAEMGIRPEELKFSDFHDSQNAIVARELKDASKLRWLRMLTDLPFFIPIAFEGVSELTKKENPLTPNNGHSPFLNAPTIAYAAFGLKAMYWLLETFKVMKTAHYQIIKFYETKVAFNQDVSFNDIWTIYHEARLDRGYPEATTAEKDAVRPLLNLIAEKFNKTHLDRKMDISALVYLFGLDKVRIHGPDGAISAEEIEKSRQLIERVAEEGLDGIRRENRQKFATQHITQGAGEKLSALERLRRSVTDKAYNTYSGLINKTPSNVERREPISGRDPTGAMTMYGR